MKKLFVILLLAVAFMPCHAKNDVDTAAAEAALEEVENSGDVPEIIRRLVRCGEAWIEAGNMDKAREYCCQAYALLNEQNSTYLTVSCFNISNSLFTIARIYRRNNEPEKALLYLDRSLTFEKSLNRHQIILRRYDEKIEILVEGKRYAEALKNIQEARKYTNYKYTQSYHYVTKLHYLEGLCKEALGDIEGAEESFVCAADLAYDMRGRPDFTSLPVYLMKLAEYDLADADTAAALERYEQSRMLLENHPNKVNSYAVYSGLAKLYASSDPAASSEYSMKAADMDFLPQLEELASKIAVDSIDFPRREREQMIRNQRLKATTFSIIAVLLMVILFFKLQQIRNLKVIAEGRRVQNESLMQSLEQKNKLLELAKGITDQKISSEVHTIADNIVADIKLSNREKEVAALIADGLLNKEIAFKLGLSVRTIENHRRSLYSKLGVSNSAELIKCLNLYLKD